MVFGNLFGNNNGKQGNMFHRTYNSTQFGLTANVTCQPGQWTDVATLTVPAQQILTFGQTETIQGGATGAQCYILLKDSSDATLTGLIRFTLSDANKLYRTVVAEERTEKLGSDQTDRNKAYLLHRALDRAKEDSKLIIEFYPDSASAVTVDYDATNLVMLIPLTVWQGGNVGR